MSLILTHGANSLRNDQYPENLIYYTNLQNFIIDGNNALDNPIYGNKTNWYADAAWFGTQEKTTLTYNNITYDALKITPIADDHIACFQTKQYADIGTSDYSIDFIATSPIEYDLATIFLANTDYEYSAFSVNGTYGIGCTAQNQGYTLYNQYSYKYTLWAGNYFYGNGETRERVVHAALQYISSEQTLYYYVDNVLCIKQIGVAQSNRFKIYTKAKPVTVSQIRIMSGDNTVNNRTGFIPLFHNR